MTQTQSAPATYAAAVSDLCAAIIDTLIDNLIALQPYAIAAAAAALCIRSITRAHTAVRRRASRQPPPGPAIHNRRTPAQPRSSSASSCLCRPSC